MLNSIFYRRNSPKGISPIITILIIFLVVVIIWIALQFVSVYYRRYEIRKKVDEKVKYEKDNDVIRTELIKYLDIKGITVAEGEIKIARQGNEVGDSVMINFTYRDSTRLLGSMITADWNKVFVFDFEIKLKNILYDSPLRN
ncbi:MAG: hypothetical protein ACP5FK_08770 [bacterium]